MDLKIFGVLPPVPTVLAVDDAVYNGLNSHAEHGVLENRFGGPGKSWKSLGFFSEQDSGLTSDSAMCLGFSLE